MRDSPKAPPHLEEAVTNLLLVTGQLTRRSCAPWPGSIRLGLPSVPPNTTSVVVVIEEEERVIGLLVDAVSDIITATEEMRQVAPETWQCRLPRLCRRFADAR
jgi:hypothetical protein